MLLLLILTHYSLQCCDSVGWQQEGIWPVKTPACRFFFGGHSQLAVAPKRKAC